VPEIYFTQKGYGPLQAILWKERRYQNPICLITNMELPPKLAFGIARDFILKLSSPIKKVVGFIYIKVI
jgi:hypothetical protein